MPPQSTPPSLDPSPPGAAALLATAGTREAPLLLTARASGVQGRAEARSDSDRIAGIAAPSSLQADGPLAITASAAIVQIAEANSVSGLADALGNADVIDGAQLATTQVGASASLAADAIASLEASALSGSESATALTQLGSAEGALLEITTLGQDAQLRGWAEANLRALARTVGGITTATADAQTQISDWLVGINSSGALSVGRDARLEGRGQLQASAEASALQGASIAQAASLDADVRGITTVSSLDPVAIGGDLDLQGAALSLLEANASSVGSMAAPADATAEVGGSSGSLIGRLGHVGIELANPSLAVGQEASLNGIATLTQSAQALGVRGKAVAAALNDRNIALLSNGTFSAGGDVRLDATASQVSSAQAGTVNGASSAEQSTATQAAIYQAPASVAPIVVGADLQIKAVSLANGVAEANSVDAGPGTLLSRGGVNHDQLYGISLAGNTVEVGGDTSLQASGLSVQQATAVNPGSAANTGGAHAEVATADQIGAVEALTLNTGGDLQAFRAIARLDAEASSRTTASTGLSMALAGRDGAPTGTLQVRGVSNATLTVGGNMLASDGLTSEATANLAATAQGTAGEAQAAAGDGGAAVIGIEAMPISVGGSARLSSMAAGGGVAEALSVAAPASATSQQRALGLEQGQITVGNGASLRMVAGLSNTALARTVLGQSDADSHGVSVGVSNSTLTIGSNAVLFTESRSASRGFSQSVAGAA